MYFVDTIYFALVEYIDNGTRSCSLQSYTEIDKNNTVFNGSVIKHVSPCGQFVSWKGNGVLLFFFQTQHRFLQCFFVLFLLAFDFCRFCVIIRVFHRRHNGQ